MCRHFVSSLMFMCFCLSSYFEVIDGLNVVQESLERNYLEQLITENYIANLMSKWKQIYALHTGSDTSVYNDVRSLYDTLKNHPSMTERRLRVGPRYPPPFDEKMTNPQLAINKRNPVFDLGLAQPVCPRKTEWKLLYTAKDMNNSEVEVFQPPTNNSNHFQWFHTVSCDMTTLFSERRNCPLCCRGIQSRRYASMCITRKSYVYALVRNLGDINYDFKHIQVDSSCNCAISPAV